MNCSPTHAPHVAVERESLGTKAEALKSNVLVGSADHESLSLTMRTVELPTWLGPQVGRLRNNPVGWRSQLAIFSVTSLTQPRCLRNGRRRLDQAVGLTVPSAV